MQITQFTKPPSDGVMAKTIKLGPDGKPASDGSACRMWRGEAQTFWLEDARALAEIIATCTKQQALAFGSIKPEFLNGGGPVQVVVKEKAAPGVIARTNKHMLFPPGEDGVLYVDHDRKGMPASVKAKMAGRSLWDVLLEVAPGLAQAARVERASTSAGLMNTVTGECFPGSGGEHLFAHTTDAADIPRATKVLHDRCALAGYGWAIVSKSGQILHRSIADPAVGTPEHLAFEGPPEVALPLAQDACARKPRAFDGGIADTKTAIPDLTMVERHALKALRDTMALALAAEAAEAKRVHVDAHVARVLKEDPKRKTIIPAGMLRDRLMQSYNGRLAPEFLLEFDNPEIGVKNVAEVLADPARFVGETLSDPLEGPSYGRCKAMIMDDDRGGGLFVHSFAHGGMRYRLMLDESMLREMIRVSDPVVVVGVFAEAFGRAVLFPGSEETLTAECAARAGVGVRIVKQAIREAREARDAAARAAMAALEPPDHRAVLPAPASDAEIGAVAEQVDAFMANSQAEEPALRGRSGKLVRIVEEPVPGMHLLTTRGVNAEPPPGNGAMPVASPPPAPPELRIVELDGVALPEEIERHVRFQRTRRNKKDTSFVRLDPPFCEAVNFRPGGSKIPMVKGVQTMPLILRRNDGSFEVAANNGFNPALGLYFRVDAALKAALPDPSRVKLEDAIRAYKSLTDDWLCDVDTDANGKAVVVAIALSIIERQLFTMRPGFFVTAALAGSGKTTVLSMVSMAVLGRFAAATGWSSSEEERQKSLFSYLAGGAPLIVWDNIKKGTNVSSEAVDRSLTSPDYQLRILGKSQGAKASASAIQCWTGNAIAPSGDLAKRCFGVILRASRVDPENRTFRHPNPVGWSLANRVNILSALYTLLCLPRLVVDQGDTRFKDWWTMVGQPIELVSGVKFNDMMKANSAQDVESCAHVLVLMELRDKFGSRPFTARDVTGLLCLSTAAQFSDAGQREATQAHADELREALEILSGTLFPPGEIRAQAVGKKLGTFLRRPGLVHGDTVALVEAEPGHDGKTYVVEVIIGAAPAPLGDPPQSAPEGAVEEPVLSPSPPPGLTFPQEGEHL
jgi:hypothetical protein